MVQIDLKIDLSDRLYIILAKDTRLLEATVKEFKSTIKELLEKFDTNFEILTKQLEILKKNDK